MARHAERRGPTTVDMESYLGTRAGIGITNEDEADPHFGIHLGQDVHEISNGDALRLGVDLLIKTGAMEALSAVWRTLTAPEDGRPAMPREIAADILLRSMDQADTQLGGLLGAASAVTLLVEVGIDVEPLITAVDKTEEEAPHGHSDPDNVPPTR